MSLSISPLSAHLVLTLPMYVHQSLSTIPHTTASYTYPGGQKQHGNLSICVYLWWGEPVQEAS